MFCSHIRCFGVVHTIAVVCVDVLWEMAVSVLEVKVGFFGKGRLFFEDAGVYIELRVVFSGVG